ncbi:MAG TPA: GNAT family N-acetyltransferase [Pantanalinema sp.]
MSGVEYARLGPAPAPAYSGLTFPAFRPLLAPLAPEAVAIAAQVEGIPAGLALAVRDERGEHAELCSLYVPRAHRGRGIASSLLERLEEALSGAGVREVTGVYLTGKPSIPALEHLLVRGGWEAPESRMLVVRAHYDAMARAPWVQRASLADGFAVGAWGEVSASEREGILRSQAETAWIAPDLVPFDFEEGCHGPTSVALRHRGEVVGWLITHLLDDVLRYTCSYVHPALQRRARILPLYVEVMRRAYGLGIAQGMWTVPAHHPAMAAFATRWMAPYADFFGETRGVRKRLTLSCENRNRLS